MSAYDLTEDDDLAWMLTAPCRGADAEVFYPDDEKDPQAYREARLICSMCTHLDECLSYALENGIDTGMWGRTTPKQRRRYRRRLAVADGRPS